jgi:hypothetical protein
VENTPLQQLQPQVACAGAASGCTASRSPIALRMADKLLSAGLLSRIQMGLLGHGLDPAKSLRHLTRKPGRVTRPSRIGQPPTVG